MKLLLFSVPGMALTVLLSLNLHRSVGGGATTFSNESAALPEAAQIISRQVTRANIERRRQGRPPIQYLSGNWDR